MRWLAALLLTVAASAAAAQQRVASLNLCTDELVLRLAAPGQLVSVSRLGGDPAETALAGRARGLVLNNGRLDSIVGLAPTLVLTSGGTSGGMAQALAARLGIRVLNVPPPATIGDVRGNIRLVAAALGQRAAGEQLVGEVDAALGTPPARSVAALMVGAGGVAPGAQGLDAALLRHAGLRQMATVGPVGIEALLLHPPAVLLLSDYRAGQASLNAMWLRHPALARLPASVRRIGVDGRGWTCGGAEAALAVAEVRRALSSPSAGRKVA